MAGLPLLTNPFILAAIALLLGDPAVFLFVRSRKPSLTRLRRKTLLTADEAEFFRRLQRACPAFMCPAGNKQSHVWALVDL
jgi:hypothetical protein